MAAIEGYLHWAVVMDDGQGEEFAVAAFASDMSARDFADIRNQTRTVCRVVPIPDLQIVHIELPA